MQWIPKTFLQMQLLTGWIKDVIKKKSYCETNSPKPRRSVCPPPPESSTASECIFVCVQEGAGCLKMFSYGENMQHCVSGMWCNLVSASTAMPSHIEKHTREQERNDMNVFTVTIAITWLSGLPNWTTVNHSVWLLWCRWQPIFWYRRMYPLPFGWNLCPGEWGALLMKGGGNFSGKARWQFQIPVIRCGVMFLFCIY